MKKYILIILCFLFVSVSASARWNVGIDGRFAPWGGDEKNFGSEMFVSYNLDLGHNFYIAPSVGLFYQKYTDFKVDGGSNDKFYRTGFVLTLTPGYCVNLGSNILQVYTGPRYAYACKSESGYRPFLKNTFDWRVGAGYKINKITINIKFDIACLKLYKSPKYPNFHLHDCGHQKPTLVVGVEYSF